MHRYIQRRNVSERAEISLIGVASCAIGDGTDFFRIKNEVAISHITKDNIYIQDETSAFAISDVSEMLTTTYTSGDRIKNLIGNATKAFGQSLFYPIRDFGAPIRNEAVEPTVTTLAQMQATPVNYESRLVRVK